MSGTASFSGCHFSRNAMAVHDRLCRPVGVASCFRRHAAAAHLPGIDRPRALPIGWLSRAVSSPHHSSSVSSRAFRWRGV